LSTPPAEQLLPRPPRLRPDGSGYDPRELDRWLQRLYSLLGLFPVPAKAYNIPSVLGVVPSTTVTIVDRVEFLESSAQPQAINSTSTYKEESTSPIFLPREQNSSSTEEGGLSPAFLPREHDGSTVDENKDVLTLYWTGV
jgi:hypothetical protein